MSAAPVQLVGPYCIEGLLGKGGMGEVYRAHDTRLDRTVALKALPSDKISDADRKRRFLQEAKAASALNHPNIVAVHDILSADTGEYLVLEYVPGKSLDARIAKRGLPVPDAVKIASQIADALRAAHGAGILHRDLKPGNVMVTDAGIVKLLDFGIAKLMGARDGTATETLSVITAEGTVAGTPSYMSPEQAQGMMLDGRSDIFSFGCVLYEMISGHRAFSGESVASTISAILRDEPKPIAEITGDVPRDLEKIVRRCLRKDPARRFQDAADLKISLDEVGEELTSGFTPQTKPSRRYAGKLVWIAAVAAGAIGGSAGWMLRLPPEPVSAIAASPLTSLPGVEDFPTLSPDGNQVAFTWGGEDGKNQDIYAMLTGPGRPLRLTTHPAEDTRPAWSPDGHWIAFMRVKDLTTSELLLVPALGGPERKIADLRLFHRPLVQGLSWSRDSKFVIALDGFPESSIFSIAIGDGEKRRITVGAPGTYGDTNPVLSPNGRALAFMKNVGWGVLELQTLAVSNALAPEGQASQLTAESRWATSPAWTADSRFLFYSSGDIFSGRALWKIPAAGGGAQRLTSAGESVGNVTSSKWTDASGTARTRIVYAQILTDVDIWKVQVAQDGSVIKEALPLITTTRSEHSPAFSPDGKRLAFSSDRTGLGEIWVSDSDGANAMQLTSIGASSTGHPRWSPDGTQIAFESYVRGVGQIFVISATGGAPRRLINTSHEVMMPSWSNDGRSIYYTSRQTGRREIWRIASGGGEGPSRPIQITKQGARNQALESADGKFVFYCRSEGSRNAVWRVPSDGGEEVRLVPEILSQFAFEPHRNGLFYMAPGNAGVVTIRLLDTNTGKERDIARVTNPGDRFTVSPDGETVLFDYVRQSGSDLMIVDDPG